MKTTESRIIFFAIEITYGYLQNGACHNFTDDVALCYASSLDEAVEIFCKLYDRELIEGNVKEAWFNSYGICICTDF